MSQARAQRREDPNCLARFRQFPGLSQLDRVVQRDAEHSIETFEPADLLAKHFRFF
jgi:hypothetical protein